MCKDCQSYLLWRIWDHQIVFPRGPCEGLCVENGEPSVSVQSHFVFVPWNNHVGAWKLTFRGPFETQLGESANTVFWHGQILVLEVTALRGHYECGILSASKEDTIGISLIQVQEICMQKILKTYPMSQEKDLPNTGWELDSGRESSCNAPTLKTCLLRIWEQDENQ